MYYESGSKYFWISFVTALVVSSIMSFIFIVFVSPYITQIKTKVDVPNLKGMKENQASLVLKNKGLLMLVSENKDDQNYENGVILEQEPLPGFSAEKGSLVKVTINQKSLSVPSEEVIPDVRGQRLMSAKDRLEQAGYIVGKIEFKESDTYGKDLVFDTNPSPGTKFIKGTIVNIVVSTGTQEVTVPALRRKSVTAARNILNKKGLKLGRVSYTTNIELPFDIIVSQHPSSGTKVKTGVSIDVVVNHEGEY